MTRTRLTAALLLAALLACAGPRGGVPSARAPSSGTGRALDALVLENDAARAAAVIDPAAARGGDAWADLGAALLARRALDPAAEVRHLVAAVAVAPDDAVALVALRRLAEVAEDAPARARAVEDGLRPQLEAGRLTGLAAYRARVARVTAAEVLGEHDRAAALRAENGAVSAWSLAGPFGLLHALDFDAPFPPDAGTLPAAAPAPPGLPPRETRALLAPDGAVTLEGEPPDAEVYYLASDVTLARGGAYVLTVGTSLSVKVSIDGAAVHERRAFARPEPSVAHLALELAPGTHRVLVKATRLQARSGLHVALSRADGAPADVRSAAVAPGAPPPRAAPARARPVLEARALAAALEPAVGAVTARLLAARDALAVDREAAKALLAEAAALAPGSAAVHAAKAQATIDDATLDDGVARGRAEAELRAALRADPGDAASRLALAGLLRRTERLDDADEALAALPAARDRADVLEERARVADARGLAEQADALVRRALAEDAQCDAAELGYLLAARRRAIADEDARIQVIAACRDGRRRLAEHLARRGDARGAAAALLPLVRARPWAIDGALARTDALAAAGDLRGAIDGVTALAAVWPRSPRVLKRLADLRELSGDAAQAHALRERALLLDGADLPLRRALALDRPGEVLDDLAEDGRAALAAYRANPPKGATSAAMVLDAAEVEIHPGGAATERTHQIFHVLDQSGVEQLGEVSVPPGADVLRLRTIKPDGRALEPERAGASKGSVSLAGLEPGDFVEVEHLRAVRGNGGSYVADPFFFRVAGTPLLRSSYVVAAPPDSGLAVEARNMPAPEVRREGGRDVVRALRTNVPALVPEPESVPMTEFLPFVQVGTGGGRAVAQRALGDAAVDRTRPTEELRAFARGVRAKAGAGAAPAALVRAAYAEVARAILGASTGHSGDDASAILSRGRGSRLLVLEAVLAELGLRARIVLARPFSSDAAPSRFADVGSFTQPLLRVEGGGETFWLDPGQRLAPFGALPPSALDVEALVLPQPGDALETVRTPARALVDSGRSTRVRVTLRPDGGAEVDGEDRYTGALAGAAKGALERLDASERRQAVEAMLARSFGGFTVSEVRFEGEDDPAAPLVIRWKGAAPEVARAIGQGLVVDALVFPARLGARFVQVASRTTPLLVPGPERASERIEIVAPEGFAARPEPARRLETPFGVFVREERGDGRTLVREERLDLARARVSPERYADFAAFAGAVDAAEERPATFAR